MNLPSPQKEVYSQEHLKAIDAQRRAEEIAFGPVVFQISRLMVKWGILQYLSDSKDGRTQEEVAQFAQLSRYAAQILLESSLTIGTVLCKDHKFTISKTGWFLLNNPMTRVNMDFNHDVNYLGLFDLEAALRNGKPEGLKVFGQWPTIYEGLSQLPEPVQKSWFGFDHYYSDCSFDQALDIVFRQNGTRHLLDVGGNTGRWAQKCVAFDNNAQVTIMDLPQQLELMRKAVAGTPGCERIHGHGGNLLDRNVPFPKGFDAIWMSQFLDCFSEEEVISILSRAAASMDSGCKLYIMETLWDHQRFETASYCLTQISVYFTALANGNSKMFHSDDLERLVQAAGLQIETITDGLGMGHSLLQCSLNSSFSSACNSCKTKN